VQIKTFVTYTPQRGPASVRFVPPQIASFPVKRRSVRFRIDVPLQIIIRKTDKTVIREGRGREMSEHGVCVMVGEELKLGEEIEIEFTPPYSGEPIRVVSAVRNRDGYRYGCEFVRSVQGDQLSTRLRQALQGFAAEKSI
jgi:hypothetical protein